MPNHYYDDLEARVRRMTKKERRAGSKLSRAKSLGIAPGAAFAEAARVGGEALFDPAAQAQGRQLEHSLQQAEGRAVIGDPAFMTPEQAAQRQALIEHVKAGGSMRGFVDQQPGARRIPITTGLDPEEAERARAQKAEMLRVLQERRAAEEEGRRRETIGEIPDERIAVTKAGADKFVATEGARGAIGSAYETARGVVDAARETGRYNLLEEKERGKTQRDLAQTAAMVQESIAKYDQAIRALEARLRYMTDTQRIDAELELQKLINQRDLWVNARNALASENVAKYGRDAALGVAEIEGETALNVAGVQGRTALDVAESQGKTARDVADIGGRYDLEGKRLDMQARIEEMNAQIRLTEEAARRAREEGNEQRAFDLLVHRDQMMNERRALELQSNIALRQQQNEERLTEAEIGSIGAQTEAAQYQTEAQRLAAIQAAEKEVGSLGATSTIGQYATKPVSSILRLGIGGLFFGRASDQARKAREARKRLEELRGLSE